MIYTLDTHPLIVSLVNSCGTLGFQKCTSVIFVRHGVVTKRQLPHCLADIYSPGNQEKVLAMVFS